MRRRGPSSRVTRGSASGRWWLPRCRSPNTGAWSTAGRHWALDVVTRRAWVRIATACAAYGFGAALRDAWTPGADVAVITGYCAAIAGIVTFPVPQLPRPALLKFRLDVTLVVLASSL